MQLDRQKIRKLRHQLPVLQVAALPAEQAAGGGIGEHDAAGGIQQHGPIRHGGDQGLLLHLSGCELFDVGFVIGLQLGGHGIESGEQFPQLACHRQIDAGLEVAGGHRAHAAQQLLHRAGDGEGVEHRPEDHQHPDGDEHRHGHFAGEGRAGEGRLVGVHAQPQHAVVVVVADQRNEHIGHPSLGGEVLPDQRVLRATAQFLRQLQPTAQPELPLPAGGRGTDRNAEVDDPIRVGEEDVADAAAGPPELLGDIREFPVLLLRHQFGDVAGEQQTEIAGVAGVVHHGVPLDAVEGQKGDAGHHQAHHQGGDRQQLGLQAEFIPPVGHAPPEGVRTLGRPT